MNVYDFDETIYPRDSSVEFFHFCLKKKPALFLWGFEQAAGFMLYGLGGMRKTTLKEHFFSFLRGIPNPEEWVEEFWESRRRDQAPWLKEVLRPGDVVISASPEFLLKPVCDEWGLELIASRVDPRSGRFTGENCGGEEKVRRFREKYPEGRIGKFYSDSFSDEPLARLAEESYMIRGGVPEPWEFS